MSQFAAILLLPLLGSTPVFMPTPASTPTPAALEPGCDGRGAMDLPTALSLVQSRSDEVAIKVLERSSAQADVALARAIGFVPSTSLTVLGGLVPAAHGDVLKAQEGTSNRNLKGLGPFVRIDANVVQPLWTWGQIDAARDAAAAGVSARTALVADTLSLVQLRVAKLFWTHSLAKRLIALSVTVDKALLEVDRRLADASSKNDDSANPSDRYRLEVFKAELGRRKADAHKAVSLSEIGIAATLAMDSSQLHLAEVPLPAPTSDVAELPRLLERAESDRKDLAALAQAIEARKAQVRASEAARYPQLFLAGQFSFGYAPNRDLQTNPWVYDPFRQLGGGLVLGVHQDLSLHVLEAQAQKSRVELRVLERQQEGLRRLVRVQVESAREEWVASAARHEASKEGAKSAKSWFRSAELNFGVGVDDAKSLVDAYTSHVENQVLLATSEFEVAVARAQLDQATGAPIAKSEGACPER